MPFTQDEFLHLFASYNAAIWPAQIFAYLLGIVAVIAAIRGIRTAGIIIAVILALFWGWTGVVYHGIFFSAINNAAYFFAALFVIQALLLLYTGLGPKRLVFRPTGRTVLMVGALFVFYAMVLYPVLNIVLGHGYRQMPVFGVAPCPMTIFTLGILLWSATRVPIYLIIIPVVWSIIGVSAAISLGIFEDIGLVVAGLLGAILIVVNNRRLSV
ncbi:MAG: DUF6064 family protein [Gammaproteobacteria bacterium]